MNKNTNSVFTLLKEEKGRRTLTQKRKSDRRRGGKMLTERVAWGSEREKRIEKK